jgi:CRISPR-associated protein Cmr3
MSHTILLEPLEPFFFGGSQTFGRLGDENGGSYLARSEHFPQQSAVLGMLRKELMIQAGLLTRKIRGEWVDYPRKSKALALVGGEKFDFSATAPQDFGAIKSIGPLHIRRNGKRYFPRVALEKYGIRPNFDNPKAPLLEGYNQKEYKLFDYLYGIDDGKWLALDEVFESWESVGNRLGGEENALYRRIAYRFKQEGDAFAFELECEVPLSESIVSLGGDGSRFRLTVTESAPTLSTSLLPNGGLLLLSDCYIPLAEIRSHCRFAVTDEVSHSHLRGNRKSVQKRYGGQRFDKAIPRHFYRAGTIFFEPDETLVYTIEAQKNLVKIGYNHILKGESL